MLGIEPDHTDGLLPIIVSYDGTYPKRGSYSRIATGYIVEAHSGKTISYKVKEKCLECLWSGNKVATDCRKMLLVPWCIGQNGGTFGSRIV